MEGLRPQGVQCVNVSTSRWSEVSRGCVVIPHRLYQPSRTLVMQGILNAFISISA